ncbi:MAG: DUF3150 domain-containing protein [Gammaproteobacteria bacterium]|nr:DUF3150 domain-containing protein [Gammaproteobacteria bacterium]MBU1655173.1 DUF3150 domain-containing protein [Gammaproteobacteria bacterium]MBU1959984.1 DUF3150 domain-containing protein [Gammaproteobacteria bacterium]
MKLSVFNFSISSISAVRMVGGVALQGALGISADLPASLHPLLRQPVISSEDLSSFEKLRKRTQEFLRRNGAFHELIGWVTDDSSFSREAVVEFMEATSVEFYAEKASLLSKYEARRVEHLEGIRKECEEANFQHCELLLELIRDAQPTLEYLEQSIQFRFLKPRIVEIHADEEAEVLTGLYGQALAEIQGRAKKAVTAPRCATMIKAASEIAEKCQALAYLDQRYRKVAGEIESVLSEIPEREKDADYHTGERMALMGMLSILSDADALDARIKAGDSLFPAIRPEPEEVVEEPVEEEGDEPESESESMPPPVADAEEVRDYAW